MKSKVTLKQIAEQANTSLATVHRVLNGKEGCGKELKEKILHIAKEQGYTVNFVASTLRKRTLNIALVFPQHEQSSRYFLQRILDGYLRYRGEVIPFNIVFQEYYYAQEKSGSRTVDYYLKQIYLERPVKFDGIVVYELGRSETGIAMLNRLVGNRIPVVMLEHCPAGLEDIFSVQVNNMLAGRMAGDMLARFIHGPGTVALINQDIPGGDSNGAACASSLLRQRKDLQIKQFDLPLYTNQEEVISTLLQGIEDLVGVYTTCARHTDSFINVREQFVHLQAAVGSELFDESYQALQSGTLDALIDKRPEQIGYQALHLLFNHLVRSEPLPQVQYINPRIILQSNSNIYFKNKEDSYENSG